jgi:hypothetical protein
MATRIKLYFIVLFSQCFVLLLAQFYLVTANKMKKLSLEEAKRNKKAKKLFRGCVSRRCIVHYVFTSVLQIPLFA